MAYRTLKLNVFRYNPSVPGETPRMQSYSLAEEDGMTIFVAITHIRQEQDPSLMFDFVCRAAICGSCGMLVNGRPRLACKTLVKDLPAEITLLPLPVFKLVGDLSVDTGTWFRHLNMRTEAWIHNDQQVDLDAQEERMSNDVALAIYEADRCVECGCCIGGCTTAVLRPDFLGAAGINRVARFMLDPRDRRTGKEYFEVVGTEEGAFGCVGLMACDDNCPMELPLQTQLSYVRRKMFSAGFWGR